MRITPLDIQQQSFKKSVRGFDTKEVQHFLELVATELENFVREHNQVKEELQKHQNMLFDVQEREKILKDTLVTAQKMTVQIKDTAEKESSVIVQQAQVQAEKIINMAYQRLAKLIDEINEMKRQRARLESEIKAVLDCHLKMLQATESDRKIEHSLEDTIRVMKKS